MLLRRYGRKPGPHGLLGPGVLLHGFGARGRLHLRLWWRSGPRLPRLLWLLGESWLWLRWSGLHAWRQSYQAAGSLSREAGGAGAGPLPREFFRLLRLALWWGIPPFEARRLGVHHRPGTALDYVYDLEAGAWSRLCSPGPEAERSRRLLADKIRCAEVLRAEGIPTVETLHCLPRHDGAALDPCLGRGQQAWFCKARAGHAGLGAFAVWREGDSLRGKGFDGRPLVDAAAVAQAWQALLERGDALVQPALRNHRGLGALCDSEEAITLRLFTRGGGGPAWFAMLEIPAPEPPGGKAGHSYVILPLDEQGCPQPRRPEDLPPAARAAQTEVCARLPQGFRVPHWEEVLDQSRHAQSLVPGLWAAAWDWVITPEGPVLLEGNAGFGLSMLQAVRGGLLATGGGIGR
ncbi:sugar-transfer associated ATP-grasp domain-containing protein [Solimonas sp. K1W22B-7]|uniref:sugar-transfer associated ATP-grasp domain-containing protein n=1 Tax=Solimonas sp. K1W22B-7 TaxID=2303331 RepID=UPI0013C4B8E5|nr:sugar-transfer associated ATP-grasp domain-containing protein [Solimonas sp. K1W22B-7]